MTSSLLRKEKNIYTEGDGAFAPSSTSFFSDLDVSKNGKEQTPAQRIVQAFHAQLIKTRLLPVSKNKRPNLTKWIEAANLLLETTTRGRIKEVAKWYFENHRNEYVPTVKAFSTFAEKFIQLEKAMVRQHPDRKRNTSSTGAKLTRAILPDGSSIMIREHL